MRVYVKIFVLALLQLLSAEVLMAQLCTPLSKESSLYPSTLCAPVTVLFKGVYNIDVNPGDVVQMVFKWDDMSPDVIVNATDSLAYKIAKASHTYISDKRKCTYRPTVTLILNGVECTSTVQEQVVTVWDTDDRNGGNIQIEPLVFPICFGSSGSVIFMDSSHWNCTPDDEKDNPNSRKRWIQWIYGTGGTTIPTALVGGVDRPEPYPGAINVTTEPILGPQFPYDQSLQISVPAGYPVGSFFQVTLRNWNYCNPYDDPKKPGPPVDLINGDFPPETTTAMALIVDYPDATVKPVLPVCLNASPFTLEPITPGGTFSGPGITNASNGMFNPSVAGVGTHTITHSVTVNKCTSTSTVNITVMELPSASITQGSLVNLCPGVELTLTGNYSGGSPGYTHMWTGDTNNLSTTTQPTTLFKTTVVGNYNLTYRVTDSNSCWSESSTVVKVSPLNIVFLQDPIELCTGENAQLDPQPSGGSMVFVEHKWTGTDVSQLSATDVQKPFFNATTAGNFTYNYFVKDNQGCSDSDDIDVIVYEQPVANAGLDADTCGLSYPLKATLTSGVGKWELKAGPGSVTFTPDNQPQSTVTVSDYGFYTFRWIETKNKCVSTDEVSVDFYRTPTPQAMNDTTVCGQIIELKSIPDIGGGLWSLASGAGTAIFDDVNADNSLVTVSNSGVYIFRRTETNKECVGFDEVKVTFLVQPKAVIEPFALTHCNPHAQQFNSLSVDATTYHWDFGDGYASVNENPIHEYKHSLNSLQSYTIKLTAKNGACVDIATAQIQIAPTPSAKFEPSVKSSCSHLPIDFKNNSIYADTYYWDFGDGSKGYSKLDTSHIFINNETYDVLYYEVTLKASNQYGCLDSIKREIAIYPKPVYTSTIVPTEGCSPLRATLSAVSGAKKYHWVFGDGIEQDGTSVINHIYVNNSASTIVYKAELYTISKFDCKDTSSCEIKVFPSPKAQFTASPVTQQMPNATVTLVNQTQGTDWAYRWDMGDGVVYSDASPGSHTYVNPGVYDIQLLVVGPSCKDSITNRVEITPTLPVIDYGPPSEGCPPLTVDFYNHSTGATSYLWEFGDGVYSSLREPSYTYYAPGIFTVKLTVQGPGGTASASNVKIWVYPAPKSFFEVVPNEVVLPENKVNMINRSQGAVNYLWNFGDGQTSTEYSPSYLYTKEGVYDIMLTVSNEYQCEDSYTRLAAVKAIYSGEIKMPNAFTPSTSGSSGGSYVYGDRENYVFYPYHAEGVVDYNLQIFNRWGELLFESNDINIGWDGYYQGKLSPQGVYVWKIRCKFSNGELYQDAGDVTLLR